jgi:hypothetical protein
LPVIPDTSSKSEISFLAPPSIRCPYFCDEENYVKSILRILLLLFQGHLWSIAWVKLLLRVGFVSPLSFILWACSRLILAKLCLKITDSESGRNWTKSFCKPG